MGVVRVVRRILDGGVAMKPDLRLTIGDRGGLRLPVIASHPN